MTSETSSEEGSESEDEGPHSTSKRRRLSVPAVISNLFARDENPTLHDGRTRRVPHVEGNYATWLYLQIEATPQMKRQADECMSVLQRLAPVCNSADDHATSQIHRVDPNSAPGWHVSLAPLLILRRQFIKPLLSQLGKVAINANLSGPLVFEDGFEILEAQHGDRWFAGLLLAEASAHQVRNLAASVLAVASRLGLLEKHPPTEALRLHCSLAWTLANPSAGLVSEGAECHKSEWGRSWHVPKSAGEDTVNATAPVHDLRVRVGDRVSKFRFSNTKPAFASLYEAATGSDSEDDRS